MGVPSTLTVTRGGWIQLYFYLLVAVTSLLAGVQCRARRSDADSQSVCDEPPVMKDATHNGTAGVSYPVGTTLRYTCDPGYSREGYPLVFCRAQGWVLYTNFPMKCSVKSCGFPGEVYNGRREGLLYSVGSQVQFICDPGYERKGDRYRTCLANAKWTGSVPTCEPIECPSLKAPSFGNVKMYERTFGKKAEFSCLRGYTLHGTRERICQADKRWSGSPVTCQVVDCGRPAIVNGVVAGESTVYGSTILFTCNPGAMLKPKKTLTSDCLETGEWMPSIPQCRLTCDVTKIDNGILKQKKKTRRRWGPTWVYEKFLGSNLADGRTLKVECNHGYHLSDESLGTIECRDGTWTDLPSCLEDPCRIPGVYGHRRVVITVRHNSSHAEEARYECDAGFTLEGNPVMTCARGKWKTSSPWCKENFCPRPVRDASKKFHEVNRRRREGFKHKARLSVDCSDGYHEYPKGDKVFWECNNTTWTETRNINCQPKPCSKLRSRGGTMKYSKHRSSKTHVTNGTVVTISCKEKYRLKGKNEKATCQLGEWTPRIPECEEIPCRIPQTPYSSIQLYDQDLDLATDVIHGEISNGKSVIVACNPGYVTTQDGPNTCRYGEWYPELESCTPSPCYGIQYSDEIVKFDGRDLLQFNSSHVKHGSSITVECQNTASHRLKNNISDAECRLGKWKPVEPGCEEIPCETPPAILHGAIKIYDEEMEIVIGDIPSDEIPNRETVIVQCDEGYNRTQQKPIKCRYGRWTPGDFGSCNPNPCYSQYIEHLDEQESDYLGNEPVPHDTSLNLVCAEGFHIGKFDLQDPKLERTGQVKCQLGKWDQLEPFCTADPCPMPRIENASCNKTDCPSAEGKYFRSGTHVEVECKDGYVLGGDPVLRCSKGSIQPTQPICSPAPCESLYNILTMGLENVTVVGTNNSDHTAHGTEVEVTCAVNFTSSHSRATCKWGKWKPETPSCVEVNAECGPPPVVLNGQHDVEATESLKERIFLSYTCLKGFSANGGQHFAECVNGQWSHLDMTCIVSKPKKCGAPESVDHARHNGTEIFPVGTTLTYGCESGYLLSPDSITTARCEPNASWSGPNMICEIPKPKDCGFPESVDHARHDARGTEIFPAGITLIYTCESGYRPSPDSVPTARCGRNGSWTGPNLICAKTCRKPELSAGISLLEEFSSRWVFSFKEAVAVRCVDTQYLEGSGTLRCGQSGQWEGHAACVSTIPSCSPGQQDYRRLIGKIAWHNDWTHTVSGFDECLTLCREKSECHSADYDARIDRCYLSRANKRSVWSVSYRNDQDILHIDMLCKGGPIPVVGGNVASTPRITRAPDPNVPDSQGCSSQSGGKDVITTYTYKGEVIHPADTAPEGTTMLSRCKEFGTYSLSGDSRRQCHQGRWNGTQPSCSRIDFTSVKMPIVSYSPSSIEVSSEGHLRIKEGTRVRLICRLSYQYGLTWTWTTGRTERNLRSGYTVTSAYPDGQRLNGYTYTVEIIFTAEQRDSGEFKCKCGHSAFQEANVHVEII